MNDSCLFSISLNRAQIDPICSYNGTPISRLLFETIFNSIHIFHKIVFHIPFFISVSEYSKSLHEPIINIGQAKLIG